MYYYFFLVEGWL